MTGKELMEGGLWVKTIGGVLVEPKVDSTCNGRVIDFYVVSEKLGRLLQVTPDRTSPWRPHLGLRGEFQVEVRSKHSTYPEEAPDVNMLGAAPRPWDELQVLALQKFPEAPEVLHPVAQAH
eukprot:9497094-Pyramimonas_sp.AAC.1